MKLCRSMMTAALLLAHTFPVSGATVAYWKLESTPGTYLGSDNQKNLYDTGYIGGTLGYDSSGNGNTLSAWTDGGECGFTYEASVPSSTSRDGTANSTSIKYSGSTPSAETVSAMSAPSGVDVQTISPSQWTVEASVKFTSLDGYQTIVGRDGIGVASTTSIGNNRIDTRYAPLYLQKMGSAWFDSSTTDKFCVQYVDEAGNIWNAHDTTAVVADQWYNIAATCDGLTLKLYRQTIGIDAAYQLVASTDVSASANSALANAGDSYSWSVGRGQFEGYDVDRVWGYIDDVRISDRVVVGVPEPSTVVLLGASAAGFVAFCRRKR